MFFNLVYGLILFIFGIFYIPHFLTRIQQEPERKRMFWERLGFYAFERKQSKVVWIHAVSVGEVMAVREFVSRLIELQSDLQIVLSTTTPTGQALAKKMSHPRIHTIYFPLDFLSCVRRALNTIQPNSIVIMETEIWPHFIREVSRRGIPIGIMNGRISDRAEKRYRWVRPFFIPLLSKLSYCFVRSEKDRNRFLRLGVLSSALQVTGNMKFDQEIKQETAVGMELRQAWGLAESKIFVGGSTHEGEEIILIQVFQMLRREFPGLKLVLAPRHIERSLSVLSQLRKAGLSAVLMSSGPQKVSDVLILDQVGMLSSYYGLADLVFVGGSLIPHGGQNPIEVAVQYRPVLHGPHVSNFEDVYARLDEEEGAFLVKGKNELYQQSMSLLSDPKTSEWSGRAAFQVIQKLRGATQRNLELIRPFLFGENVYRR